MWSSVMPARFDISAILPLQHILLFAVLATACFSYCVWFLEAIYYEMDSRLGGLYLFLKQRRQVKETLTLEFKARSTCQGQSSSVKISCFEKIKTVQDSKTWRTQFRLNKGISFSSALNKGSGLKMAPYLAMNTLQSMESPLQFQQAEQSPFYR